MTQQTLRTLIASNDFSAYKHHEGSYGLRGETIEEALYSNNGSGFVDYAHDDAFFKQNKVDIYDISTWICTDTHVGLQVMRLAGTPVAIIWQPFRKTDPEMVFLSDETRDAVRAAWEAARPNIEVDSSIIDDVSLDMPLAEPKGKQFDISGRVGAMMISLSSYGAAQWIDSLKDSGGLAGASDPGALTHALHATDGRIAGHEDFMRKIAALPEDRRMLADLTDMINEASLVREMRNELAKRLEEVTGEPVAPAEPVTQMPEPGEAVSSE